MSTYRVTFCLDVEAESTYEAEKSARNIVNSKMSLAKLGYYTHVQYIGDSIESGTKKLSNDEWEAYCG